MAERERPTNWEDWKWLHRWPRLTSIEWGLEWLVYWCRGWRFSRCWNLPVELGCLSRWSYGFGRLGPEKQKHYRAWELINSARGSTGDGGRRDALRDLNEDKVDLSAAPLARAWLSEGQLPKADLVREADLPGADLRRADLTGRPVRGQSEAGPT